MFVHTERGLRLEDAIFLFAGRALSYFLTIILFHDQSWAGVIKGSIIILISSIVVFHLIHRRAYTAGAYTPFRVCII